MTVTEKVRQMLVKQLVLDDEEVTPGASLVADLGADSLDVIELVMACEEEFWIEIPDADTEALTRVGDIVTYLEGRLAAAKT